MRTCRRCSGEGGLRSLDDHEVAQGIFDLCYHCGGSGRVTDEVDDADEVEDMLMSIAWTRAYEWRAAVNSDPEGEGFDFRAAENGMSPHDYLTDRTYYELSAVQARYALLDDRERAVLLAWHRSFQCQTVNPPVLRSFKVD